VRIIVVYCDEEAKIRHRLSVLVQKEDIFKHGGSVIVMACPWN